MKDSPKKKNSNKKLIFKTHWKQNTEAQAHLVVDKRELGKQVERKTKLSDISIVTNVLANLWKIEHWNLYLIKELWYNWRNKTEKWKQGTTGFHSLICMYELVVKLNIHLCFKI